MPPIAASPLPLVLVFPLSGCATLTTTIVEDLGAYADQVLEEASESNAASNKEIRAAANRVDQRRAQARAEERAAARAEVEASASCKTDDYDSYFETVFKMFASSQGQQSDGKIISGLVKGANRQTGLMLRVCGELTARILNGDEPFRGNNRDERISGLLAKRGSDYKELKERFPAFRTWVREMMEVR